MKLWECTLHSGATVYPTVQTVYVVGNTYKEVENILLSEENQYWRYRCDRVIKSISLFSNEILVYKKKLSNSPVYKDFIK